MKFKLLPQQSIGPVKLGFTREQARNALQQIGVVQNFERGASDYFLRSCIQVEYDEDGTVTYIGISSDKEISLEYEETDLFDVTAEEAFVLIAKNESEPHFYNESEYLFPNQIISLYDADPQYDQKGNEIRTVWGAIGIGDLRYLEFCNSFKKN